MSQKITVNFTPEVGANMRKNGINRGKVKKSQGTLHLKDGNSTSHCLVVTREQKFWGTGRMAAGSSLLQSSWPDLCSGSVQCAYTHFKPLETCVSEQHDYHWHDGVKRFFKCPCGNRTISLDRLPQKHCRYENSWGSWSHRPPEPFCNSWVMLFPRNFRRFLTPRGSALFCASLQLLGIPNCSWREGILPLSRLYPQY